MDFFGNSSRDSFINSVRDFTTIFYLELFWKIFLGLLLNLLILVCKNVREFLRKFFRHVLRNWSRLDYFGNSYNDFFTFFFLPGFSSHWYSSFTHSFMVCFRSFSGISVKISEEISSRLPGITSSRRSSGIHTEIYTDMFSAISSFTFSEIQAAFPPMVAVSPRILSGIHLKKLSKIYQWNFNMHSFGSFP